MLVVNTPNTRFLLVSSLRPEPEDNGTAALADNPGPAASQTASSDPEAKENIELTEPPVVEDVKTASPNLPGSGEAEGSGQASSDVPDIQANTVSFEETEAGPTDEEVQNMEEEEAEGHVMRDSIVHPPVVVRGRPPRFALRTNGV